MPMLPEQALAAHQELLEAVQQDETSALLGSYLAGLCSELQANLGYTEREILFQLYLKNNK